MPGSEAVKRPFLPTSTHSRFNRELFVDNFDSTHVSVPSEASQRARGLLCGPPSFNVTQTKKAGKSRSGFCFVDDWLDFQLLLWVVFDRFVFPCFYILRLTAVCAYQRNRQNRSDSENGPSRRIRKSLFDHHRNGRNYQGQGDVPGGILLNFNSFPGASRCTRSPSD